MAEGARREYSAIFSIGGKLQGSFRGAFSQAQSQMRRMQRSVVAVGRTLKTLTVGLLSLTGILGGLAIGKMFSDLFGGAQREALEAHQRVRNLTSAFMRLQKVQQAANPIKTAQEQVALLQKETKALSKNSLLHDEIYDSIAAGLARFRIYPQEIVNILPALSEMLVELKGVSASEEDALELGKQFGLAISSGNVRAIRTTGVLNKEQLAAFAKLRSSAERYKFILNALSKYSGTIGRAMNTPEGRLQLLTKYVRELRHELGEEMLPIQAEIADMWRDVLPVVKPVLFAMIRAIGEAMKWISIQIADFIKAINTPPAVAAWNELKGALGELATNMGLTIEKGSSLGKVFGGWIINQMRMMANELRQIMAFFRELKEWLDWYDRRGNEIRQSMQKWSLFARPLKEGEAAGAPGSGNSFWSRLFRSPSNKQGAQIGKDWSSTFKNFESAYGLPKGFLRAIAAQENVNPAYNNPLGLSSARGVNRYPTYEAGVAAAEKQMRLITNPTGPYRDFVRSGYKDIEAFARVWAPVGASNDVYGTNATEAAGIRAGMARFQANEGIPPLLRRPQASAQSTSVNFAPNITINGNATEAEQRAMDSRLRDLATEFIARFNAAQYQERRLSYQGGYG